MAETPVTSLRDGDTLLGRFAGIDGEVPVKHLLGHAGLVTVPTTAYKLRKSDAGKLVKTTNGSAVSITVPPASEIAFPDLAVIAWEQGGAGQVIFVDGGGVTINTPETLKSAKQYASGVLIYEGSDVWILGGYLEAA